jgi:hypothetical protein
MNEMRIEKKPMKTTKGMGVESDRRYTEKISKIFFIYTLFSQCFDSQKYF